MQQDELLRMAKNLVEDMDKDSLADLHKFIRDDVEQCEADYIPYDKMECYAMYRNVDGGLVTILQLDADEALWYIDSAGVYGFVDTLLAQHELQLVKLINSATWNDA